MKTQKETEKFALLFEEKLQEFLKRNNLYYRFVNGQIRCRNCEKIINYNNLGFIQIKEGQIYFICDDIDCLKEVKICRG